MSQKFCNILVTWVILLQFWMLLLMSWKWWTTLDCEMSSSSDTLWVLLDRFASVVWSTALKSLAYRVECLPMAQETGVQSQVESYQRLKKWYLILPRLTLTIIRYVSRVKWINLWKEVVPSLTPRCSSYWKRSLWVTLDYDY